MPEGYGLGKGGKRCFIDPDERDLLYWFNGPQTAQDFELHIEQAKVQGLCHAKCPQQDDDGCQCHPSNSQFATSVDCISHCAKYAFGSNL